MDSCRDRLIWGVWRAFEVQSQVALDGSNSPRDRITDCSHSMNRYKDTCSTRGSNTFSAFFKDFCLYWSVDATKRMIAVKTDRSRTCTPDLQVRNIGKASPDSWLWARCRTPVVRSYRNEITLSHIMWLLFAYLLVTSVKLHTKWCITWSCQAQKNSDPLLHVSRWLIPYLTSTALLISPAII